MDKEFRSSDGAISVKLSTPEIPVPEGGWRTTPREYDWATIVGALREAIRFLHDNRPAIQSLDPAADRASFLMGSGVRKAMGNWWTVLYHTFLIDPRRDDGVGVKWEEVEDTLYLCLQEQRFLQIAALQLWRTYRDLSEAMREPYGGRLDYGRLGELERAVQVVASMTVDKDAYDFRTQSLALRTIEKFLEIPGDTGIEKLAARDPGIGLPESDDEFNVKGKNWPVYDILRKRGALPQTKVEREAVVAEYGKTYLNKTKAGKRYDDIDEETVRNCVRLVEKRRAKRARITHSGTSRLPGK